MKLEKMTALVAGGASGLGEAVCQHLAAQDLDIVVLDKSEAAALKVANQVQGLAVACDITDPQVLESAFAQLKDDLKSPLRVVVNCAGIAPAQRMVGKEGPAPLDWFTQTIQVNLIGTFNVMRLAAALMIQTPLVAQERGVIINTASVAAFEGQIGQTAYSASKGGVVAMTLPAARELAPFAIRVLTIAPGLMDTPMLRSFPPPVQASLQAQCLFPTRFGLPQEYAELVAHIIQNPLLNAEVIRLDGGLRMGAR